MSVKKFNVAYNLLWIYILFLTLASNIAEANKSVSGKPNVVIFFTDDQGTLDAHCFGSEDLYTPAIDKLATTGTRFTQAYGHTVCCPSRAMLLTGRYPQRSNVSGWTQANAQGTFGRNMNLEEVTLAEILQRNGYKTALFGKWHLGADFKHGAKQQGFDEFFGIRGGFIDNYRHYALHGIGFHDLYEGTNELFAEGKYFPDMITKRALDFIDKNESKPFLLYIAYNIPHYPEQADEQFEEKYKNMSQPRKRYAKMISTTDNRIGQIITKLEEKKLRKDTIVIFMSDNGHSNENYQIQVDNHSSGLAKGSVYAAGGGGNTGKWIGNKGTFLEGGIRVPTIISYPAMLPKGIVRHHAITAMDWMPTILELCDIDLPEKKLDGKSLVSSIIEEPKEPIHQTMHWAWQEDWAVREGNWKLIGKGEKSSHLLNLSDDKPEQKNYIEIEKEILDRLKNAHEAWFKEVSAESAQ